MTECFMGLADKRDAGVSLIVASCSARARVASALHSAWRCASAVGNPNCHAHSQANPHTPLPWSRRWYQFSQTNWDDTVCTYSQMTLTTRRLGSIGKIICTSKEQARRT